MAKKFRKPVLNPGLVKDPDADWNEPAPDPVATTAKCADALQKIEQAPPHVWKRSAAFLEDVSDKLKSVRAAAAGGYLTRNQEKALEGWVAAVNKCVGRTE